MRCNIPRVAFAACITMASIHREPVVATEPSAPSSGIDRATFDAGVGPGQDFFRFVNGNWIARNPIRPDQTAWGVDQQLHEQNLAWLREIVEAIGPDAKDGW